MPSNIPLHSQMHFLCPTNFCQDLLLGWLLLDVANKPTCGRRDGDAMLRVIPRPHHLLYLILSIPLVWLPLPSESHLLEFHYFLRVALSSPFPCLLCHFSLISDTGSLPEPPTSEELPVFAWKPCGGIDTTTRLALESNSGHHVPQALYLWRSYLLSFL
jgi:hypothetical protein